MSLFAGSIMRAVKNYFLGRFMNGSISPVSTLVSMFRRYDAKRRETEINTMFNAQWLI
jgi:hypothetical protein